MTVSLRTGHGSHHLSRGNLKTLACLNTTVGKSSVLHDRQTVLVVTPPSPPATSVALSSSLPVPEHCRPVPCLYYHNSIRDQDILETQVPFSR